MENAESKKQLLNEGDSTSATASESNAEVTALAAHPADEELEGSPPHTESPPNTASPVAKKGGGKGALIVAIIALLVAVGAAAWSYWSQMQLTNAVQQDGQQLAEDTNLLTQKIVGFNGEIARFNGRIEDANQATINTTRELISLKGRQDSLQNSFESLRDELGRSETGWKVAEVEYLLRIANHRVQLQRDVATAIAALKAADARIRDLAEPALWEVREMVIDEMSALRSVSQPDYAGMAAQLNALANRAIKLSVGGAKYTPPAPDQVSEPPPAMDVTEWKKELQAAFEKVKDTLQESVKVHVHERPLAPMMAPDQQYLLRENLRLKLEGARLALLRQDQALFQASLDTAAQWLEAYFEADNNEFKAVKDGITQLRSVALTTQLPDISGSLRLLRKQVERKALLGAPQAKPDNPADINTDTATDEASAGELEQ